MSVSLVEPPKLPDQFDALQKLNWLYLVEARKALHAHFELGRIRFRLDQELAQWIANSSDVDFALSSARAQTLFRLVPVEDDGLTQLTDNTAALLASANAAAALNGD